jgi:hypothetical protein
MEIMSVDDVIGPALESGAKSSVVVRMEYCTAVAGGWSGIVVE